MGSMQKRQKQLYDRSATGGRFAVGDMVWLHSPAVPRGKAAKFHRFWKGPFQVKKVLSDVTYQIQSTAGSRRQRLVVHFNHLKPAYESPPQQRSHPRNFNQPVDHEDVLTYGPTCQLLFDLRLSHLINLSLLLHHHQVNQPPLLVSRLLLSEVVLPGEPD